MDPRLPYALGALAGMVRADAANEAASGSPDGTVSDALRSALTVADQLRRSPGGVHAIRSGQWSVPAGGTRDRLLCAVPIGIAMSTIDPEALAETVWIACGCTNRNEFQSAALLAAAVSLRINNWNRSIITTLCDAVDVVSAMKPRGESQEGPDVLTATRRALNVQANSHSPLVRVRTRTTVLMEKLADVSPSISGRRKCLPYAARRVVTPRYTMLFPLRWPVCAIPARRCGISTSSPSRGCRTSTFWGSPTSSSCCPRPLPSSGSVERRGLLPIVRRGAGHPLSRNPIPISSTDTPPLSPKARPPLWARHAATLPRGESSS